MSQVLQIVGNRAVPFEHAGALMTMIKAAEREFPGRHDAVARYSRRMDAITIPAMLTAKGIRMDAFEGGGVHLPRQLEHIHTRVLEEKHPVPNGLSMFRTGSSVPPGARTHTVRRFFDDGEVAVYRNGSDIPRVGVAQAEEEFVVRHYVTSMETDHFELLSSNFANTSEEERKTRSARKVMELFLNRMTWGIGPNDAHNIYGVINYPWLAKKVAAVPFIETTAVNDILKELREAADFPEEESDSVFMPNRMATTSRVRNFLMQKRLGSVNDTTIGQFFIATNAHINAIEEAWELKGIAGDDVDGILFWNDSEDGVSNEIVQSMTALPMQSFGFRNITFWYMSHGGVIMRDVGGNLLLLVTAVA
jgi:hypothetical protein